MIKTLLLILAFAQRDYRAMPEDYEDDLVLTGEGPELLNLILTMAPLILVGIAYLYSKVRNLVQRCKDKIKLLQEERQAPKQSTKTSQTLKPYKPRTVVEKIDKSFFINTQDEVIPCIIIESFPFRMDVQK